MSYINVTAEFGIIVRRSGLVERGVSLDAVLAAVEVSEPMSSNQELLSFGPNYGKEALDAIVAKLMELGLEYYDDFFEFSGFFPAWCNFHATLDGSSESQLS